MPKQYLTSMENPAQSVEYFSTEYIFLLPLDRESGEWWGADHGTGAEGFITTETVVYAELIYGDHEPAGMIVKEIDRDNSSDELQWKDFAGDQGAKGYVRMLLLSLMRKSETHSVSGNYGDLNLYLPLWI